MRLILKSLILLIACVASAQTISYFNNGFLRQPSAAADRAYLGINGTNAGGTEVEVSWPLLASTNGVDPILISLSFDQGFTNGLATIAYVDASGTIISNALFALIPSTVPAWASVVSAGTNALVLTNSASGTNNYTVNGLTDTNVVNSLAFVQARNATNGLAIANTNLWDPLGAAQTATNQLAIANTNLWDPLGSAQNATNTARLAINLAGTFDPLGAALNATNGITSAWIQGKFPGVIVTNGNLVDVTMSNAFRIDAAHALSLSNSTASRVAMINAANQVTNATASGAVPIDADGTATTSAQLQTAIGAGVYDVSGAALTATQSITSAWIQGKFPGVIVTNGNTVDVTMSNNFRVDIAHTLSLSNLTAGALVKAGADNTVVSGDLSGDVTTSGTLVTTLKNIGTAGTYDTVVTDNNGRVTNAVAKAGYSWTVGQQLPTGNYFGLCYGRGRFLAVSQNTNAVYTQDGATWISNSIASSQSWNDVTYGNGLFVAVASSTTSTTNIASSSDGVTWTVSTLPYGNNLTSVTYGNGVFVAVGSSGTNQVFTSSDGVTWAFQTAAAANQWRRVAFGNNLFVAVSDSGGQRVMVSSDGTNWTAYAASVVAAWQGVCYGNGKWVAVGNGQEMYSTTGTNWTTSTATAGEFFRSVAYGAGYYVACANGGGDILVSRDGITWSNRGSGGGNVVAYGNNTFIVLSVGTATSNWISGDIFENKTFLGNVNQGGMVVYGGITNKNATASRMAFHDANTLITSAAASGAVPIDADGTATTSAQVQALFPGLIVTNGETQVITVSNTFGADAAHFMNGPMSPSLLTNGASAGSRIQITDANKKVIDSAASGAVPIDADGTATTFVQVQALAPGTIITNGNSTAVTLSNNVTVDATHVFFASDTTNNATWQSANYTVTVNDTFVLLTGAHTATMPSPSAAGAYGKLYWIQCASAGTNAILPNAAETFNVPGVQGAAKLTNTAIGKAVLLWSNRTNWWGTQF